MWRGPVPLSARVARLAGGGGDELNLDGLSTKQTLSRPVGSIGVSGKQETKQGIFHINNLSLGRQDRTDLSPIPLFRELNERQISPTIKPKTILVIVPDSVYQGKPQEYVPTFRSWISGLVK